MLDQFLRYITIAGWVFLVLYLIILVIRGFQEGGMREVVKNLASIRLLVVFICMVLLAVFDISLVYIEPQRTGVVLSLFARDGYRDQPFRSGLHWIIPLAEKVVLYPVYWQNYTMSSEPGDGTKFGNDSIGARTSDGQEVNLDCSVIFQIDANDVIRVHIDWQNRYMEDFVRPVVRGIVRTEVSQFTADEVNSSKRKNLESNLDEQLRQQFRAKGFILDRFLLRKITFSSVYAAAIEAKQVAEQQRVQREYQAVQMRKLAEGERDRLKLEAEGRAQARVLEGQADAQVVVLKGQAEAQALHLISDVLSQNPDLITYRYVDKLSSNMKVMLVPGNNPLILPVPEMDGTAPAGGGATPAPGSSLTPSFPLTYTFTSTLPISPTIQLFPTPTPMP